MYFTSVLKTFDATMSSTFVEALQGSMVLISPGILATSSVRDGADVGGGEVAGDAAGRSVGCSVGTIEGAEPHAANSMPSTIIAMTKRIAKRFMIFPP
jgi:hypothetical protein